MLPDKLENSIIPFDWNCYYLMNKTKCSKCKADWFWQIGWQWSSESTTMKRNFRLEGFNRWEILKYNIKNLKSEALVS